MHEFIKKACAVLVLSAVASAPALAAGHTWKISLGQMPFAAESKDKGAYVDIVKAMAKATGDTVDIQVVPFARSLGDVIERKVDMHLPLLQLPGAEKGTDAFDYSTDTVHRVNFVIFSGKTLDITPSNAGKFHVETDAAHTGYFGFPITPSPSVESSIRKVDAGRLDAFIYADAPVDRLIRDNKLKNLKRQLFKRFDVKFVLPKGARGGEADKFITDAIAKLKASGEWSKLIAQLDASYDNWQP